DFSFFLQVFHEVLIPCPFSSMKSKLTFHRGEGTRYQNLMKDLQEEAEVLKEQQAALAKNPVNPESLQRDIVRTESRITSMNEQKKALFSKYPELPKAVSYAREASSQTYLQRLSRLNDTLGKEVNFKDGRVTSDFPSRKIKIQPNGKVIVKPRTLKGVRHPGHHITGEDYLQKVQDNHNRITLAYQTLAAQQR
ncbi:MAG: hypothetical protein ACKO37_03830, partial [Vampirovibrionales bacterium]